MINFTTFCNLFVKPCLAAIMISITKHSETFQTILQNLCDQIGFNQSVLGQSAFVFGQRADYRVRVYLYWVREADYRDR